MEEMVKARKRARKPRVTREKQTLSEGNQERGTKNTFQSVQNVENNKGFVNRKFWEV